MPMSTKPFFLTYVKWETDVRKKNGLVDTGFLVTGQRTRLVPSRPMANSGQQHSSETTDGGEIGSVDTGLYTS